MQDLTLILEGGAFGIIGYDYLFNDLSKNAYPFDYETFKLSMQKFIPVITNTKFIYIWSIRCINEI